MIDKTNPYWRELRRMDSRIKDRKEHGYDSAAIRVGSVAAAESLVHLLVARNAYDSVDMMLSWEKNVGYTCTVAVYWEGETE